MPTQQEQDLLKVAKEIVALLEDEKEHEAKEIHALINKMTKILGPNYANIPGDLKKTIGVTYGSALGENDILEKAMYARSALSLLRTAVKIAHGTKNSIEEIDSYIRKIDGEIHNIENSNFEDTPPLDKLWKYTYQAIDYISFLTFRGYGEFRGDGFQYRKSAKDEVK